MKADLQEILLSIDHLPAGSPDSLAGFDQKKLLHILHEKEALQLMDADTVALCRRFADTYDPVLAALRQNRLEGAEDQLQSMDEAVGRALRGVPYLYTRQASLSVHALLRYKQKEFGLAHSLLLECIALNEFLVRLGCVTLTERCIDQNLNLAKLYLRSNRTAEGICLYGSVLDFLVNGNAGVLEGTLFREEKYWEAYPFLRECLTVYALKANVNCLITLTAEQQTGEQRLEAAWLFNTLFKKVSHAGVNRPLLKIMQDWFDLKLKLLQANPAGFAAAWLHFFSTDIPGELDILKASLCQDLLRIAEESRFADKEALLDKMVHSILQRLKVSTRVKSLALGGKNFAQISVY